MCYSPMCIQDVMIPLMLKEKAGLLPCQRVQIRTKRKERMGAESRQQAPKSKLFAVIINILNKILRSYKEEEYVTLWKNYMRRRKTFRYERKTYSKHLILMNRMQR